MVFQFLQPTDGFDLSSFFDSLSNGTGYMPPTTDIIDSFEIFSSNGIYGFVKSPLVELNPRSPTMDRTAGSSNIYTLDYLTATLDELKDEPWNKIREFAKNHEIRGWKTKKQLAQKIHNWAADQKSLVDLSFDDPAESGVDPDWRPEELVENIPTALQGTVTTQSPCRVEPIVLPIQLEEAYGSIEEASIMVETSEDEPKISLLENFDDKTTTNDLADACMSNDPTPAEYHNTNDNNGNSSNRYVDVVRQTGAVSTSETDTADVLEVELGRNMLAEMSYHLRQLEAIPLDLDLRFGETIACMSPTEAEQQSMGKLTMTLEEVACVPPTEAEQKSMRELEMAPVKVITCTSPTEAERQSIGKLTMAVACTPTTQIGILGLSGISATRLEASNESQLDTLGMHTNDIVSSPELGPIAAEEEPTRIVSKGSRDDPITIEDYEDILDKEVGQKRQRSQEKHHGMVNWAAQGYAENIAKVRSSAWEEIQEQFISVDSLPIVGLSTRRKLWSLKRELEEPYNQVQAHDQLPKSLGHELCREWENCEKDLLCQLSSVEEKNQVLRLGKALKTFREADDEQESIAITMKDGDKKDDDYLPSRKRRRL